MAIVEQISQMKQQGVPTGQIIQLLKEQGYSPKEINEALSQSEIKTELNKIAQPTQEDSSQPVDSFQPSIYGNIQESIPDQNQQLLQEQFPEYAQTETPITNYQNQSQYPEYSVPQSIDIESITEIVTQIIDEKMQRISKEFSSFFKFKKQIQEEIKVLKNNIDKIENTINALQLAIIKKIGEYGDDIKNISNELKATQDSFSKIINPLTDKFRNIQNQDNKIPEEEYVREENNDNKDTNQKRERPKRTKDDFESYLR